VSLDSSVGEAYGIGLRPPHYADVLDRHLELDFVEVISENFMVEGGRALYVLDAVAERLPVALHGVSMSIGNADGLDRDYLNQLKRLVDRVKPVFVSDHLCWTGVGGVNTHDLLPLPYTAEALAVVSANVTAAQDFLGRTLLIENPSTYVTFVDDEMTEAEFLSALCGATGCDLLLDVNNIYVSSVNHGYDTGAYLNALPRERVKQIHIAGHSAGKSLLIDTHDTPVSAAVWSLYEAALTCFGPTPTMVERDDNIPSFDTLLAEINEARARASRALCVIR
jgi:uncharacterized protein